MHATFAWQNASLREEEATVDFAAYWVGINEVFLFQTTTMSSEARPSKTFPNVKTSLIHCYRSNEREYVIFSNIFLLLFVFSLGKQAI